MSEETYKGPERYGGTDSERAGRVTALLNELAAQGGADPVRITEQEEYLKKLRAFLEGQDFLKLGYALNGGQWDLAMLRINKMRTKTKELGITCFDHHFGLIRGAVLRRSRTEALQILTRITAKRVALRNILGKADYI